MKLTRLELQDFKQFRQPLVIEDLQPGINLFVGPNESGKTTITDAVRAAFFERYKSGSVSHLQPWDDSGAAPQVTLAFDWQGDTWHLCKRFLKKPRCDLTIGSQQFSGEQADNKLAELLGYEFAGRGASKAEHHGIPGLLWAEQGAAQNIGQPAQSASSYLQQALGNTLGEIASSSGDDLIRQVEAERSELLTKTGNPRGVYRETSEQCDEKQAQLQALQQRIATYREQVDRLGTLRQQQRDIDAAEPWQAERDKAKQAQAELDQVKKLQDSYQQTRDKRDNGQQQQALYRQQLQAFDKEEKQLAERQADKDKARQQLDELKANQPKLEQRLAEAGKAHEQATQTLQAVRRNNDRQTRQAEHDQLAEQIQQQDKTLQDARQLQTRIGKQRERLQALAVDADQLQQLRDTEQALRDVHARQQAVATRIAWDLQPGQSLDVAGDTATGRDETLLLEDTRIDIPTIGTLTIQPGGSDVAELRREHQHLSDQRDTLLQSLNADSLQQAEQRAEQYRELKAETDNHQTRLDTLAPAGVDALVSQRKLQQQKLEQLADKLAELPSAQPELPTLGDAEMAEQTARDTLRAVEGEQSAFRSRLAVADNALTAANEEWRRLQQALAAPDRKQRQHDANKQLTDLKAAERQLDTQLQQLEQQIEAANPELLQQDVERHTRSAEAMEQEARTRSIDINKLQAALEAQGADGLEEQAAELEREITGLQRRRDELAARAEALDLLLQLLRDKRRIVTQQLQAPLQKHLNRYLGLLFPGARLTVDENLVPQGLARPQGSTQEQGELVAFSFGAREQMGLISRLAYADLLAEAGRPTLIILDDALVHSDPDRLAQMKRILFDAAQRHQILLFSCHPDNWRDLGVTPTDMQTLKVTSS